MKWKKGLLGQALSSGHCRIGRLWRRLRGGSRAAGGHKARGTANPVAADRSQRLLSGATNAMTTSNMQTAARILSQIQAQVEAALQGQSPAIDPGAADGRGSLPDAIDRENGRAPLETAVSRVRLSQALEQFRRDLETESLTVATLTNLLQIVQQILPLLSAR